MLNMVKKIASIIFIFKISVLLVKTNEIAINNSPRHVGQVKPPSSNEKLTKQNCSPHSKLTQCTAINNFYNTINSYAKNYIGERFLPHYDSRPYKILLDLDPNMKSYFSEPQSVIRRFYMTNPTRIMNLRPFPDTRSPVPAKTFPVHRPGIFQQLPRPDMKHYINAAWNVPLLPSHISSGHIQLNSSNKISHKGFIVKPPVTMAGSGVSQIIEHKNMTSINIFTQSLDHLEQQFYKISFTKLTSISPTDRQENGMSFVQSSLFLLLTLMALWKEVDSNTKAEIDQCIGFNVSDMDSVGVVKHFITSLPKSSDKLKLRQSSRVMLWPGVSSQRRFKDNAAAALMFRVEQFNSTVKPEAIAALLNKKVELDSGGAIHDTFDVEDLSGGVTAVLVTTLYVRGRWRAAPTVLNGTRPFRDSHNAPNRTVRMIRINDVMKYADLQEWDAQALEIAYATRGLSLLMLIPRGNSLKSLAQHVGNTSIGEIGTKMKTMRISATVPIYTLRMTLLLPNKLQAMGIQSLVDVSNGTQADSLKLSHAVQRIMFWAEAGRNAYKDDGIEWEQTPELGIVVDRPYIFFVRWHNITLINGNFVL